MTLATEAQINYIQSLAEGIEYAGNGPAGYMAVNYVAALIAEDRGLFTGLTGKEFKQALKTDEGKVLVAEAAELLPTLKSAALADGFWDGLTKTEASTVIDRLKADHFFPLERAYKMQA